MAPSLLPQSSAHPASTNHHSSKLKLTGQRYPRYPQILSLINLSLLFIGTEPAYLFGIMAISPTVLASAPSSANGVTSETNKFAILPLVAVAAVSVAITAIISGSVLYYLMRSGHLTESRISTYKAEIAAPATTRVIAVDPLLVNLSDPSGTSYLRVGVALQVVDMRSNKNKGTSHEEGNSGNHFDESIISVRDTLLSVLGRQTSDELLAPDGKERLKAALKASLQDRNPELKTQTIFFTDFLVQR